ncbi:hypothetical protein ROV85_21 [Pantoea phage ROV85]
MGAIPRLENWMFMRAPPSTQMTARTPMTCARISLATCAILPRVRCAARQEDCLRAV